MAKEPQNLLVSRALHSQWQGGRGACDWSLARNRPASVAPAVDACDEEAGVASDDPQANRHGNVTLVYMLPGQSAVVQRRQGFERWFELYSVAVASQQRGRITLRCSRLDS